VATQVELAKEEANGFARKSAQMEGNDQIPVSTELQRDQPAAATGSWRESATPEVYAHSVEFVTLPGRSKELQRTIPETLRCALGNSGGFFGCMVFVSNQEARLMTVITLWTGSDRTEQCDKISDRLHQVLLPYVDCWLRTQKMATFLCWPQGAQSRDEAQTQPALQQPVTQ
jgi:hypothetical protein